MWCGVRACVRACVRVCRYVLIPTRTTLSDEILIWDVFWLCLRMQKYDVFNVNGVSQEIPYIQFYLNLKD